MPELAAGGRMKGPYWPLIGAVVGLVAGSAFGTQYAIAGIGIGMAGGLAIYVGMR
jgi:hypothetical protein